jgi:hypothetical protein
VDELRGFEDWTMEDVKRHNEKINKTSSNNHFPDVKKMAQDENKKSKYGAKKCEYEGIKFDSQKERDRYIELKLLEKGGGITDLQLQVPFVLQDSFEFNGKKILPIKYIADFTYWKNGELVIEDVKGKKTDVYELKKKMFMYRYKKYIREV